MRYALCAIVIFYAIFGCLLGLFGKISGPYLGLALALLAVAVMLR